MGTLEDLRGRVESLIRERTSSAATVTAVVPLSGGACQDNVRIDVTLEGPLGTERRFVLRSDAASSLPGSLGRAAEYVVIEAVGNAHVRTPKVQWLTRDLVREGAGSFFMDWLDGVAIGRKIVGDASLAEARTKLPGELADELAKIHSITPETHRSILRGGRNPDPAVSPVRTTLSMCRTMIDALDVSRPAMEIILSWLEQNAPSREEVVLVHGDYRTGNFLVTPAGLNGVLDWEFARWGAPQEDIAWLCMRDWRFGKLDQPVGGFAQREPFYRAYEKASGRRIDPVTIHYWEVAGNLWWSAGCVKQAARYFTGLNRDIELIAIGRRAAEMEWEALRLIEQGPGKRS